MVRRERSRRDGLGYRPVVPVAAGLLATALVLGCGSTGRQVKQKQRTFDRLDEAGRVIVGVQSVAAFEDYVDSLQPKFELTPAAAYQEAIAQTQIQELEELHAFLLEVAAQLPQTSRTVSTTTERREGVPDREDGTTDTRTETHEEKSPEVPTPAIPQKLANTLATIDAGTRTFSTDPALRYRAAAALLQEVALLSNYVKDAAVSAETIPYVVRQLITVFPSARREPYDVYTTIAYFGGEPSSAEEVFKVAFDESEEDRLILGHLTGQLECKGRKVEVVPLFVTDNLETTWLASSRSAARDIGASVAGGTSNIGLGLAGRSQQESEARNLSRDLNSLFTVGRVADNAVEVRIGAASVDGTYQLVPRTFNLTSLVLVPRISRNDRAKVLNTLSSVPPDKKAAQRVRSIDRAALDGLPCKTVRYAAHTEMRHADTGELLRPPTFDELVASIQGNLTTLKPSPLWLPRQKGSEELVEIVLSGEYEDFLTRSGLEPRERALRWAQLSKLLATAGYASGSFPIYRPRFSFFDNRGEVYDVINGTLVTMAAPAILDDGKAARLRLTGGQGLSSKGLSGRLEFTPLKGAAVTVAATAVKLEDEGRSAVIEFPSILKLMIPDSTAAVGLSYRRSLYRWSDQDTIFDWYRDKLSVIDVKPEEKKDSPSPFFTVEPSSFTIRAIKPGEGQLTLLFRKDKGEEVPPFTTVRFMLRGAHILPASIPTLGSEEGYPLAQVDTMYLLNLGGLIPGSVVTLEAWRMEPKKGGKADEKVRVSAPPIMFSVVGPETKKE